MRGGHYEKMGLIPVFLLCCLTSVATAELFSSAALLSAESFISSIDKSDFSTAYDSASTVLQLQSPQDQWVREQGLSFQLLGKAQERQLKTVRARDSYPGLPDGNYLIVCYQTRTEYKDEAIEVLLLREQGPLWQVCKYSIR